MINGIMASLAVIKKTTSDCHITMIHRSFTTVATVKGGSIPPPPLLLTSNLKDMEKQAINIRTTIEAVRDAIKNSISGQLYLADKPEKIAIFWSKYNVRVLNGNNASYFDNERDALARLKDILSSINDEVETPCNASDLQPLQPVLVRDDDLYAWELGLFGRIDDGHKFPYICIGQRYAQCIPYDGNEHLLGTIYSPKQKV